MIDVDALKQQVDLVTVVGHYTPLMKRGREWVGKCIAHSPDANPSMYVVPEKGFVKCFACGFSGDVVEVVMQAEGLDFKAACERLGAEPQWEPALKQPRYAPPPRRITSKPPIGESTPDMHIRALGSPKRIWCYRDAEGDVLGYVARYETDEGKEIRCWTWGAKGDDEPAWGCQHWNPPRPLYGLDRLAKHPTAPVMVVEGEKACDAATRLLPAYVVVTWPGGAVVPHKADWSALKGRRVLLWPDNDEPGIEAMNKVAYILADPAGLGCQVRVVDPNRQPVGWDLADAEADGWITEKVIAFARERVKEFHYAPEVAPEAAPEVVTEPESEAAPQATETAQEPPAPEPEPTPRVTVAAPPAPPAAAARPKLTVVGGRNVDQGNAAVQPEDEPLPLELSESGIADEFAATHHHDFKYVPEWKLTGWHVWNGQRWQREHRRSSAMQRMRYIAHGLKHRAAAAALPPSSKNRLESRQFCGNVLDFVECDRRIMAAPDIWDADPYLLGTPAGTVDLRTGKLMPPERSHYITRQTTVTPTPGPTPLFDMVLGQAAGGDPDMLAYLWRWLGYLLTGSVQEEAFMFLHGPPACGKSTLIEAVAAIMGDAHHGGYAVKANMELFTESHHDKGAGRFHIMFGARFAHAAETEEGRHWKAAQLKEITGGDTIIGERKYENEFSFRPSHKFIAHGNWRPHLRNADPGVRRRMHIVEYRAPVDKIDQTLKQRLVLEYPAILARMIEGCMAWQATGLAAPKAVLDAVDDYYESEDSFGAWFAECVVQDTVARLPTSGAYRSYKTYLEERGEHAPSQKRFATLMAARGYLSKKSGTKFYDGLKLATDTVPEWGAPY